MPSNLHVKRDDEVVVITGKEKGKRGKITAVITKKNRVLIEGINLQKKHVRKNQQNPNGAILEREGSIHVSNVMLAAKFDARAAKRAAAQPAKAA
ncbi:MAG: 50S ribosomal protein L24 [Verrucomicrobia bacterium]|nr:50S ribosomal protein L24 [Verrucomicrobiota bacterium]NBU11038.1 50S ribosomal protein L24 [Pseudomonadota bacterium]NDA68146.1 50S ribosomal protein L24 [Verrucomicrobiota bacterium]NDB77195.1 50S ribosomal protein L24 [Verrucomicrobiota bacterium]NDD39936.1 50S ribosomal protein L24 [Verrucomicrobiota bacterium]